jgi:hypothetical protein
VSHGSVAWSRSRRPARQGRGTPNCPKKHAAGSFAVASASRYLLAVGSGCWNKADFREIQLWHVFGGCSGSGKPDADWSSPLLALLTAPA